MRFFRAGLATCPFVIHSTLKVNSPIFFSDCAQQQAVKDNVGQPLTIIMWNQDHTEFLNFTFPNVIFNTADIDPVQGEPLTQTIAWNASIGGDCNTTLFLQRSFTVDPLIRNRIELCTTLDNICIANLAAADITRTYEWGDGTLPEVTAQAATENHCHNYVAPYGAGVIKTIAMHAPEDTPITASNLSKQGLVALSVCMLEFLQILDASENQLTEIALENLQDLTTVNLAGNPLESIELDGSCNIINLDISGAALPQSEVDEILEHLAACAAQNGTVDLSGGTSATPGAAGALAIAALIAAGWTVITN